MTQKEILFLSANPEDEEYDQLKVIDECKKIRRKIESAKYGNEFRLEQEHRLSISEIQELLTRSYQPQIVHFSGHGKKGFLLLQDEQGNVEKAKLKPFANTFKIINESDRIPEEKKVRCVILNACYSESIAKAVAEHVDCVIGMSNMIRDLAGIVFAESFYFHLCSGESIKDAFEFAKNQVEYLGIPGQDIPKLKVVRSGIDASNLFFCGIKSTQELAPIHNDDTLKTVRNIPILVTTIEYLFEEGRRILREREERRNDRVITEKSETQIDGTLHFIDSKEDLLKQHIVLSRWANSESKVRHLMSLMNMHTRNYYLAKEQYAKWGSGLVPPIVANTLQESEGSIVDTINQLKEVLTDVFDKKIIIDGLQ